MTPQPEYHAWKKRFIAERSHEPTPYDAWCAALAATGTPQGDDVALDDLIDRVLNAQQDLNLAANETMSQPLASAAALLDEVEAALRRYAALASQGAAPASECDSPKLCAVNKGCAGQYGTERVCSTPTPIAATTGAGDAEPLIWIDAGHLREVLNGNDMPAYCQSDAADRLVPLYAAHQQPAGHTVAHSVGRTLHWHEGRGINDAQLYAGPQQPAEVAPAAGSTTGQADDTPLETGEGDAL